MRNQEDPCPCNAEIAKSDFSKVKFVDYPEVKAKFPNLNNLLHYDENGRTVTYTENPATNSPIIFVNNVWFSDVEYEGIMKVNTNFDEDFIGVVFGLQVFWKISGRSDPLQIYICVGQQTLLPLLKQQIWQTTVGLWLHMGAEESYCFSKNFNTIRCWNI